MEKIEIYIKGRQDPIQFIGEYLGHKLPYGKTTENWHYYRTNDGRYIHCRKDHIQMVISNIKQKIEG